MTATDLELLTRELDQNPDDRNLLLAIGELWEETETGIGVGVRAIVKCDRKPWFWRGDNSREWGWWVTEWHNTNWPLQRLYHYSGDTNASEVPDDWLDKIGGDRYKYMDPNREAMVIICKGSETFGASKAYLAAARAVLKLPEGRQRELLEGKL